MRPFEEFEVDDSEPGPVRCTAFAANRRIASGTIRDVALAAKRVIDKGEGAAILIFDDRTSEMIEVDFRGTPYDVEHRLVVEPGEPKRPPEKRGPGRPRLGVTGREVTLLPRHWDWLDDQPGGASVALRKLVEAAKRENREKDRARRSRDAAHRFMSTMAGDLPGFEEASRALYAGNRPGFETLIAAWPGDIREHLKKLAAVAARDEDAARQEETAKRQMTRRLGTP